MTACDGVVANCHPNYRSPWEQPRCKPWSSALQRNICGTWWRYCGGVALSNNASSEAALYVVPLRWWWRGPVWPRLASAARSAATVCSAPAGVSRNSTAGLARMFLDFGSVFSRESQRHFAQSVACGSPASFLVLWWHPTRCFEPNAYPRARASRRPELTSRPTQP